MHIDTGNTGFMLLCCSLVMLMTPALGWDDALEVWGVHGVGGILGTFVLGILATTVFNSAGTNGLLHGNVHFFLVQCVLPCSSLRYGPSPSPSGCCGSSIASPHHPGESERGDRADGSRPGPRWRDCLPLKRSQTSCGAHLF
jgi:Ammonium Transporter Family